MKAYKKNIGKQVEIKNHKYFEGRKGKIVGIRGDMFYLIFINKIGSHPIKANKIKFIK